MVLVMAAVAASTKGREDHEGKKIKSTCGWVSCVRSV